MSSAISCIVIKSDRLPRKIPTLGETVRVVDRYGLYVVMNVDCRRRVIQLMQKAGKHELFDVPFASVRTVNRNLANTIERFLASRGRTPPSLR